MLFLYALCYCAVMTPALMTVLSWHYNGSPGACWRLRLAEQLELMRIAFLIALALGASLLALSYSAFVIWHYMMIVTGEAARSEAAVKRVVFQIYTLIISVPAIAPGIFWGMRLRHEARQFFGYERPQFFNPGNS